MLRTSAYGLCAVRSNRCPKAQGRVGVEAQVGVMVLVDISDRLLALDEVTGHHLVYGELLIGDRGGRKKLLAHA